MKKLFYTGLTLISFSLITASCSKKDDNKNNGNILTKAWKVNDKKYEQAYSGGQSAGGQFWMLVAVAEAGSSPHNSFAVAFKTRPTADGTYKVAYKSAAELLTDEVLVSTKEKISDTEELGAYAQAAENEGKIVTVKIVNGKVDVTVPQIKALKETEDGGEATVPVTIEGNIQEQ